MTANKRDPLPPPALEPTLRLESARDASDRDAVLLARTRDGDVAAFEAIVVAYAEALVAFAYRYVRSSELAADLTQDVFARVWERRATLEIRGSLKAYLYSAVHNRALNAIRHEQIASKWRDAESRRVDTDPDVVPPSDRALEGAELLAAVNAALATLPPRTREVARLRWQEQMSLGEIAAVMEIAVSTVSNQLTRATKRMRALLAGVWP